MFATAANCGALLTGSAMGAVCVRHDLDLLLFLFIVGSVSPPCAENARRSTPRHRTEAAVVPTLLPVHPSVGGIVGRIYGGIQIAEMLRFTNNGDFRCAMAGRSNCAS
jgi:hypothetical protein